MEVQIATDGNFDSLLSKNQKVVVKFHAGWCGSCRLFKPKYKRIAKEEENQSITFLDINAEENPESRKSAGVNSLPFFTIYQDGELVDNISTNQEGVFRELLNKIK